MMTIMNTNWPNCCAGEDDEFYDDEEDDEDRLEAVCKARRSPLVAAVSQ